jgi:hypothetical protein
MFPEVIHFKYLLEFHVLELWQWVAAVRLFVAFLVVILLDPAVHMLNL